MLTVHDVDPLRSKTLVRDRSTGRDSTRDRRVCVSEVARNLHGGDRQKHVVRSGRKWWTALNLLPVVVPDEAVGPQQRVERLLR